MTQIILLTGATGFVGKQILKAVANQDVMLRLVVRKGTQLVIDPAWKLDRIVETTDLFAHDSTWWGEVCQGVDTIIHCAWYAKPGKYLQSSKNIDCLIGTLNLAKGCVTAGVRRFVGIGTCFEYDLSLGVLSTETSLKPITPYAAAKASAYIELSQFFSAEHIEFVWCRLFYLYGEGEDSRRLVPYIHQQLSNGKEAALSSGTQIRDFLDVVEAGRVIAQVAKGKLQGSVNICSGVPITVRQLAEQIADKYERCDLLKFGTRPDNIVDPPCVVGVRTKLEI